MGLFAWLARYFDNHNNDNEDDNKPWNDGTEKPTSNIKDNKFNPDIVTEEDIIDNLTEQLKKDEGFSSDPYFDSRGIRTIGYGTNLNYISKEKAKLLLDDEKIEFKRGAAADTFLISIIDGITKETATKLLEKEAREKYKSIKKEIKNKYGKSLWTSFNHVRKRTIANMAYNLGTNGTMQFKLMFRALMKKDYSGAAQEMLDSDWHKQTGRRCERLAKQMRKGKTVTYNDNGTV